MAFLSVWEIVADKINSGYSGTRGFDNLDQKYIQVAILKAGFFSYGTLFSSNFCESRCGKFLKISRDISIYNLVWDKKSNSI